MLELFGRYSEKTLTIDELPIENFRKVMKLKIYLNSNRNLSYSLNGQILSISFAIDDEVINSISPDLPIQAEAQAI